MGSDLYLYRIRREEMHKTSPEREQLMHWRRMWDIHYWFKDHCDALSHYPGDSKFIVEKQTLKDFYKWSKKELWKCRKEWLYMFRKYGEREISWEHIWHKISVRKLPKIIRKYSKKYVIIFHNSY